MRIDAHQHFWTYNTEDYGWIEDERIQRDFGPQDLKPLLEQHHIDGCVLVQVNQTEEETQHFHQIALENEIVKAVVGWTDLFSPALEERLQEYKKLPKVKGFRHIVQGEPVGFMKNPEFVKGVKLLGKYGFTYDILIYPTQMKDAVHLVRECPDVTFILDHLAKPYIREQKVQPWANYMKELGSFPNLYCKVSGMVTEAAKLWRREDFQIYMDFALASFGMERLMYGSDWPVCLSAADYSTQLALVEGNFNRHEGIFGLNAIKAYGIS